MTDSHTSRLESALAGRYKIHRKLGEGGMAGVYLAEDIKHERNVALKILKPELAAVIGAERFLAEIKTTANLQHPHILPLFDSGEADGFLYYVMPYIEGETLRDRIEREGQLGVEEAVRIARDVADALDYAHRNDIIHRDIKPANILLHDGRPVVADFGIALAISAAGGGRMTETGLSLGTPHYMSPEQASADRDLSARSDVYSLGCVLYEMLAGQPPHTGPSAQSILVRILTEDPRDVTELRRTVPPNVAAAVMKSIEKLPADRFDTARQLVEALDDPTFSYAPAVRAQNATRATSTGPAVRAARSRYRTWLPWAAAGLLGALAAWGWLRPTAPRPVRRMVLVLDSAGASFGPAATLSPDGSRVAYVGAGGGLWVRSLQSLESQPIQETSRVTSPFFSPDGQRVGFRSGAEGNGRLATVSLGGEPPVELASGDIYPGGTWSDDGYVYFATSEGALQRVREGGGPRETVADTAGGWWAAWPDALPGGEFVMVSVPGGISAVETATGEIRPLLKEFEGSQAPLMARYAGGYLFWVNSARTLLAAPFDPRKLGLTAPPVALSSNVVASGGGSTQFDVSEEGTLIYAVGGSGTSILQGENMGWVDRDGTVSILDERLSRDIGDFDFLSLGPSPRYIAAEVQTSEDGAPDEEHQVWIYDVDQQTFVRLTLEGRNNVSPRWLDERTVIYLSDRIEGSSTIFAQAADGSGSPRAIFRTERPIGDFDVSRTDGLLAVTLGEGTGGSTDIVVVDPAADGDPVPLVESRFDEGGVSISRDGRWIAYVSTESGRREVYVRAFPDGSRRSAISNKGAASPQWSPKGDELFYVSAGGRMVVASLDMGERVSVRSRSELFLAPPFELGFPGATYDVDADGERLLAIIEAGGEEMGQHVVVLNVFEELKARGRR
ncbi:MAG: protein kinase [Gemmatimonadota bacterium]|jgi:serine/threonine-protein kinase